MLKNVLVVVSHFPPNPTGGVMRVAKLSKYLPEFGWNPIVLTSTSCLGSGSVGLLKDVEKVTSVYRLPSFDIRKIFHLLKVFFRKSGLNSILSSTNIACKGTPIISDVPKSSLGARFLVPDFMIGWIPLAVIMGVVAVLRHRIKAVYSTSPLPSGNIVAYLISNICRIPWIMDMRDPWTTNPMASERAFTILSRFDLWLEKMALNSADHIVVVAEQFIPPLMKTFPFLKTTSFSIIHNGYDPDDFQDIKPITFDKFTILHAGAFYEGRSATPLLEALNRYFTLRPQSRNSLQVIFVGDVGPQTSASVDRLGLSDIVNSMGTVSHQLSLEYIAGADLLLLIPGPGKSTMTGKIFEYLAVRKPILALAGEGAVSGLIASTRSGVVVSPDDIPGIADAISFMYDAKYSGHTVTTCSNVDNEMLKPFDRREIARKVAALLDSLMVTK